MMSETAVWAPSPDVVSSLTYLPPPPPDSDPPPLPWTASPAGIAKVGRGRLDSSAMTVLQMRLTGALQFQKKMTEEEEKKILVGELIFPPLL